LEIETMNFDQLPRYQPRSFVPEQINLRESKEVVGLFEQLLKRAIHSAKELEQWLRDRSELQTALDQQGSILYIRMTCQTDDQQRSKDYQHFIESVVPAVKPLEDKLNRKYLEVSQKVPLDKKYYEVYDRAVDNDIHIFREENVPLQTKVALLSQEYQTICGTMTVVFNGREHTMPEMSKYLLETNRGLRESVWRTTVERRLRDKDKLDGIFDQMLGLRHAIAVNASFQNFCDYQFRAYHRFDYTPEDCKKYHTAVEKTVVPLWKEILEKRRQEMNLSVLRPWDLEVDPLGQPPLRPFEGVEKLISGVKEMFKKADRQLGEQFEEMSKLGLLDLASRKGKAPGGYQSTLAEARKPFIFMNAVGLDSDVRTLLHEAGHAFHTLACAHHSLSAYRHGPMEFNEVASMTMELLGGEHIDIFYSPEEVKRSNQNHFEDIIGTLVWVAVIDCFQHWIYENPQHTPAQRNQMWLSIRNRFGGNFMDWSGLEEFHQTLWHRQLHIFEVPFYYIEYAIAQLGALQLWQKAKRSKAEALAAYKKGLSLGGSRPLPELYQAAGIKFDFSEKTIQPLIEAIRPHLVIP